MVVNLVQRQEVRNIRQNLAVVVDLALRESTPRQTDKKSRVPKEEKGVWGSRSGDRGLEFSRRWKGQTFLSTFLVLVNYTTQFKLCTRDYTTMYSA